MSSYHCVPSESLHVPTSLCPSMSPCDCAPPMSPHPHVTVLLNIPMSPGPHISVPLHVPMSPCHCAPPCLHVLMPLCSSMSPCPHITVPLRVPISLCPSTSPCPYVTVSFHGPTSPCPLHVPMSLCPSMSHTVCPALPCASSRTGPQHPHTVPTSATTEQIPILGPLFSTPPPLTAILGTASPHRRRCGDAPRALPWGQRCPQHRGGGAGGPPPLSHCLQLPQVQVHPR